MGIDYLIECVTYDKNNRIDSVEWRIVFADSSRSKHTHTKTRNEVLKKIYEKSEVWTRYKKDGKWHIGAQVKPFDIGGTTYIKTKANDKEEDNLGEIDECV